MTRGGWLRRPWIAILLAALTVGIGPSAPLLQAQAEPALQVTLFAIVATPDSGVIDPKLAPIAPQLRNLLPDHGFKLLGVRSRRLRAGQSIGCDLGQGLIASTTLVRPVDENGKVELHCILSANGIAQFNTLVTTPPNQLFFCDQMRDDGTRLLIGVGAR